MSNTQRLPLKPLAMAITLAAGTYATTSFAQEAPSEGGTKRLEEVLVTAQKRIESIQDVPLSVTAVSGDKLNDSGIENIEDLTVMLPNIHFTETGISTQVRVRGVGSDNSQGFEQSVGMYVDGIYYGRAQLFRSPMMDMQRAELLRGPQSTLFGKNSIAGALNLTTARPTEELEGRLSISHGFEFNQQEINGVISGPITDEVRGRIAVRTYEDDGYMTNNFTGEDQPSSDEASVRVSLEWSATDNLNLFMKAQHDSFDVKGRAIEMTLDVPLTPGAPTYSDSLQNANQQGFDANLDFRRDANPGEFSNNEVNNFTLIADYDWNDYTITAVTGLLSYDYAEKCDCDFVAAKILDLDLEETYDQFSQEIRIASPLGEKVEWLAGAFYQSYDQTFGDYLSMAPDNLLVNLRPILNTIGNTAIDRDFSQTSTASSLFGRATINLSDNWHLTVGGRISTETKEAHKEINIRDLETNEIQADPLIAYIYSNVFLLETDQLTYGLNGDGDFVPLYNTGHNVDGKRKDTTFSPLINLQYDINADMMTYVSFTQGSKAGGFDPRSNSVGSFASTTPLEEPNSSLFFEFEEESAKAFEWGLKSTIADGQGELNLALYRTEYDDLQSSQFDGGVGFNVGNVKDTLVQGIEVDGRWLLVEGLTLSYGASFLDFEYKDFKNGNCFASQEKDGIDLDGDGDKDTCDYTGKRGVYTPELTFNTSLDAFFSINSKLSFVGAIDWQHISSHQVHVNLDPMGEIDAYNVVTARAGVEADNWSVALLAKNLLDEKIVSYSANAPLSDTSFGTNTYYSFVRRPQTVSLEATIKF